LGIPDLQPGTWHMAHSPDDERGTLYSRSSEASSGAARVGCARRDRLPSAFQPLLGPVLLDVIDLAILWMHRVQMKSLADSRLSGAAAPPSARHTDIPEHELITH